MTDYARSLVWASRPHAIQVHRRMKYVARSCKDKCTLWDVETTTPMEVIPSRQLSRPCSTFSRAFRVALAGSTAASGWCLCYGSSLSSSGAFFPESVLYILVWSGTNGWSVVLECFGAEALCTRGIPPRWLTGRLVMKHMKHCAEMCTRKPPNRTCRVNRRKDNL